MGDLNNDKNLDLLAISEGDTTIQMMFGNGDSTFHDPIQYTSGSSPRSVVVNDFNRDNKLDLAIANAENDDVAILLNSCS